MATETNALSTKYPDFEHVLAAYQSHFLSIVRQSTQVITATIINCGE
jgi:hypothetical protein